MTRGPLKLSWNQKSFWIPSNYTPDWCVVGCAFFVWKSVFLEHPNGYPCFLFFRLSKLPKLQKLPVTWTMNIEHSYQQMLKFSKLPKLPKLLVTWVSVFSFFQIVKVTQITKVTSYMDNEHSYHQMLIFSKLLKLPKLPVTWIMNILITRC